MAELDQLAERSESLRRELGTLQGEIVDLEKRLTSARRARRRAVDLLGVDLQGRRLRLAPLIWSIFGAVFTLTGTFATYVTAMVSLDRQTPSREVRIWLPVAVVCLALAGGSLLLSRRPGAGGLARAVLRPMTLWLGGACLVALLVIDRMAGLAEYFLGL